MGGDLGFSLGHLYPRHTSAAFSPVLLKGSDAALLAAARQLGLEVKIVPVWAGSDYCYAESGDRSPGDCMCHTCADRVPGCISRTQAVGQELVPLQAVGFRGGASCTTAWRLQPRSCL